MSRLILSAAILAAIASLAPAQQPAKPTDIGLAAVPTDAFLFASAKVSKLWDNPAARPLRDWFAAQKIGPFDQLVGVHPADIDRVTYFQASWDPEAGSAPVVIITTRKALNEAAILKALKVREDRKRLFSGVARAFEIEGGFHWVVFLDDRTVLYLSRDPDQTRTAPTLVAKLIARKPDGPLAEALAMAEKHDAIAAVDVRGVADFGRLIQADRNKQTAAFFPLLEAKSATLTADVDRTAKLAFTLTFADAATARRRAPMLEEGIKMLHAERAKDRFPGDDPLPRFVEGWFLDLLKNTKVAVNGTNVIATAEIPIADDIAKLVAVLPKEFGVFSNEASGVNNLKQLAIAMHSYHDVFGTMCGDVGTGPKPDGWSWRVQLLPYIEQDNLYKVLNHQAAWNDPENLKVLEKLEMPKIFEAPGRPAPKGQTYFRVFSLPKGSKAAFAPFFKEGARGPKFSEVVDGLSNTFMIVEAEEAVPWYKPDVLAYDGKLPLPGLGAKGADKFLACFGDGSVKVLRPSKLDEKTLRALITINGGEVVDLPK